MAVESNPSEAQIFKSGKHIFLAPETRSGSTSFADSHVLSLCVDFIEECLFNGVSSESFVSSFNVF